MLRIGAASWRFSVVARLRKHVPCCIIHKELWVLGHSTGKQHHTVPPSRQVPAAQQRRATARLLALVSSAGEETGI